MNIQKFWKILAIPLLIQGFCGPAQAYKYISLHKAVKSERILREAIALGLGNPKEDAYIKKELREWKKARLDKHLDSAAPDDLILEVRAGTSQLNKAKIMARFLLFKEVQKHWSVLKNTLINEFAKEHWTSFVPYLKRDLKKIEFKETLANGDYIFSLPWGEARISKALTKASWKVVISENASRNKLEPGVENIHIPN